MGGKGAGLITEAESIMGSGFELSLLGYFLYPSLNHNSRTGTRLVSGCLGLLWLEAGFRFPARD